MSELAKRMADAAGDFLAGLDDGQRSKATYGFGEEERSAWFFTPTEHGGLAMSSMDPVQQQSSQKLVVLGLSAGAYVTTATIMGLERTLALRENFTDFTYPGVEGPSTFRDPGLYYVSIFGEPGADPWGWRFEGHHVSLNYTIGGETVRPLPTFFGDNPADSEGVGGQQLRPLGPEEDLGRELLQSLDDGQRATAILATVAPADIITTNVPRLSDPLPEREAWQTMRSADEALARMMRNQARQATDSGYTADMAASLRYADAAKGLAASAMNAGQRDLLTALIRQYIDRMPDELAESEWARLGAGDALDAAHFAWAGSAEKYEGHYYRIQGPELFIEYDNTQNDANHIHSVWRDAGSDFGGDLLAEHYAAAH